MNMKGRPVGHQIHVALEGKLQDLTTGAHILQVGYVVNRMMQLVYIPIDQTIGRYRR